jgi:hypothetical protein
MAKKRKTKAAKKTSSAKKKKVAPKRLRTARAAAAAPPYKCATTLEPGVCLRFNRNPRTGQYNLPPGGIRVPCNTCEYFFD